MGIIFITGAPGVGKSSVVNELLERGCTAYDTDDSTRTGIAGWHVNKTGECVAGFNELPLTQELFETHTWRLTDAACDDFKRRSISELIYLAGRLRDPGPLLLMSRRVIFLVADSDTIRKRLVERAQNFAEVEWGREEWQIEKSIRVNQEIESEYRAMGALMLSAGPGRSLAEITDDIIAQTAV